MVVGRLILYRTRIVSPSYLMKYYQGANGICFIDRAARAHAQMLNKGEQCEKSYMEVIPWLETLTIRGPPDSGVGTMKLVMFTTSVMIREVNTSQG